MKTFEKFYKVIIETNNRFPLRVDAIDYFINHRSHGEEALQIDKNWCPLLIRALKGGWRYEINPKKDIIKGAEAEDNQWTHPGDAFGYLCRFFHKKTLKQEQYGAMGVAAFVPPRRFGSSYNQT